MNGLHVRTRMLKIYDIHFLRTLMYVCIFSTHKSSKNEKISFSLLGKKQKAKTQNTAEKRERKKDDDTKTQKQKIFVFVAALFNTINVMNDELLHSIQLIPN